MQEYIGGLETKDPIDFYNFQIVWSTSSGQSVTFPE